MNFDHYETLWRAQGIPVPALPAAAAKREALFDRIRAEALRLDRAVFWRDTRELSAAFLVAALFAVSAWRHTHYGDVAWGRWIAVAITLGVALVLLSARRKIPRPPAPGLSLLEQLDLALSGLRGQADLLRRVPRVYAAPLFAATLFAGLDPLVARGGFAAIWSAPAAALFLVALAVAGFVVWINRLALRRLLAPKIAELEQLRAELTDPRG